MRTLAKPPKAKQPSQQAKQATQKKEGKSQSKKVVKTVFNSPFRYKIQTLSHEDGEQIIDVLINYAKTARSDLGISEKKILNEKFIGFDSKVVHEKPPLVTPHLVYGVKNCLKVLKRGEQALKMVIFFYDQNVHDMLQELMCSVLYNKLPYVLLKDSQRFRHELGVKKLLCLGVCSEQLSDSLFKFCSRCLIQIPWLFDSSWISLRGKG